MAEPRLLLLDEPVAGVNPTLARDIAAHLRDVGVRVEVDRGRGSFGRRVTDWEIKGVPLRIEVGPRDLAQGLITVVRRDNGEKTTHGLDAVASEIPAQLERVQSDLLARAIAHRDGHTYDVTTVDEALEAANDGFARLAWDVVSGEGEKTLNAQAVTVRCLQRQDGSLPVNEEEQGLVCLVAKSY